MYGYVNHVQEYYFENKTWAVPKVSGAVVKGEKTGRMDEFILRGKDKVIQNRDDDEDDDDSCSNGRWDSYVGYPI